MNSQNPFPKFEVPRQWRWHHQALLKVRTALLAEEGERKSALRVSPERGGTDSGDAAARRQESDELLAELLAESVELSEVDAALARLRAGTYGVCEATGAPISPERLRAIPWTRLSQSAAARREERRAHLG